MNKLIIPKEIKPRNSQWGYGGQLSTGPSTATISPDEVYEAWPMSAAKVGVGMLTGKINPREVWHGLKQSALNPPMQLNGMTAEQVAEKGIEGAFSFSPGNLAYIPFLAAGTNIPKDVLVLMNRKLKSKGYDVRGAKDVQDLINKGRVVDEQGNFTHPDWKSAYDESVSKLNDKKLLHESHLNVDRDRIKKLGYTVNLKEAGYITPEGKLVDFSGKREGGTPGFRAYDHREAGGTAGMQEYRAEGNIRINGDQPQIDLAVKPTKEQYKIIAEIVKRNNGNVVIDLQKGLGEFDKTNHYYLRPSNYASLEFESGTSPKKVIEEIEKYFEEPKLVLPKEIKPKE